MKSSPRLAMRFLRMSNDGVLLLAHRIGGVKHGVERGEVGGRNGGEHFLQFGPGFLAVEPPAGKFRGVGGHEGWRIGVLRLGGDDFQQTGAAGFGRGEEEVQLRAVVIFAVAEAGGLQAHQAGRGQRGGRAKCAERTRAPRDWPAGPGRRRGWLKKVLALNQP